MSPSLVILAAGMGSRYGGLKQIEPLGPQGQTILDYSIADARRAGFGEIVFIIRREFSEAFRERIGRRYADADGEEISYVFQEIFILPDSFKPPAGREKPWGTAHAVWCARKAVRGPFAVINADDFYGAESFHRLAEFLKSADPNAPDFALAGYKLGQTLSEHGTVSRGVCKVDAAGFLTGIEEKTAIESDAVSGGARTKNADGTFAKLPGDTVVSMNCWAFTPALFPLLEGQLINFLREKSNDLKAECYLPTAVGALVAAGAARVRVLPTQARWFGLTYPADKPVVQAALKAIHESGEY